MLSCYIFCILGWFIAAREVHAVLTNITLVPPSDNISLNGPGWTSGPGSIQCGELPTVAISLASDNTGAQNVSVTFQGISVYFVGWNNGPDFVYQAFVDGVPDPQFTAYTPSQPEGCGVIFYSKTGLVNADHTLVIKSVAPTSLEIKGFIVTTDDNVSGGSSGSSASTLSSVAVLSSTPASPLSGTPVSSSSTAGPSSSSSSSNPGLSTQNGPGSSNSSSPTVHSAGSFLSRPGGIGTVVGGIIGGLVVLGLAALWAHGVIQAMLGIFPWTVREFKFGSTDGSHQIILTLTPVEIDKAYPCEQVVWQEFTISPESREFTAKLKYQRAFGIAVIDRGARALADERICKEPDVMRSAKPGRTLPFDGSAWAEPLQFMPWKRTRIIARNNSANRIPQRLVIGSYIGDEVDEEKEDTAPLRTLARFQPFVVMEENVRVKYDEEFSASDDLILRAYKTKMHNVTGKLSGE
ncbi:hypothetical protein B0H16DRAFT_783022 [Mycena metata]|uniref:Uncharacterized protein n=1 Tax=Mycena metata TaxID=1033252 RepID=A0AAD7IY65_9AGAR|nr:hypothetical protein B0H16DRAFT_783022 [Mycena metata]